MVVLQIGLAVRASPYPEDMTGQAPTCGPFSGSMSLVRARDEILTRDERAAWSERPAALPN